VKPLKISEPASQELAEAVRWYEERRPGWGARLFDAVASAIALIESHPEIGPPRRNRLAARQLKVRGLPVRRGVPRPDE
jgi:plasmid stabilization system protein ParE